MVPRFKLSLMLMVLHLPFPYINYSIFQLYFTVNTIFRNILLTNICFCCTFNLKKESSFEKGKQVSPMGFVIRNSTA